MSEEQFQTKADLGGGPERTFPGNYPGNSYAGKKKKAEETGEPRKKMEKIVSGGVRQRKGLGRKFRESLLGEGGIDGVVETFVTDILVGALKGMISDAVGQVSGVLKDGVDRFLWGDVRRSPGRPGPYTAYNRIRPGPERPAYNTITARGRSRHDFTEVIIPSRADAVMVLDELLKGIELYGMVKVADFYDLVGITGDFPDHAWGWDNLETAAIRSVRGGYLIMLPRPVPIN
jgi:hypothetical protein